MHSGLSQSADVVVAFRLVAGALHQRIALFRVRTGAMVSRPSAIQANPELMVNIYPLEPSSV